MINDALKTIEKIKSQSSNYWSTRIISQLEYSVKLSKCHEGRHDETIIKTVDFLWQKLKEDDSITKSTAQKAEEMMESLSKDAKSFKMICVAHAHIDMNWMWRWDETVSITLDTFRTMLNLMDEYPEFTFSQSQASVYRIAERYNPEMLEEIKKRIKEKRWEVTASTWVETDKNMPSGESLARHILYTKKTLSELLELDPDSLSLDFEPDTFGHSRNVPEILSKGGVKYYYHCRGYDGYNIYRWKAPSGKSIIVYREPHWYLGGIEPDLALYVPEFCTKHGIDTMLKVYGVGDHGGGPTRRDIERILDMSKWPVFPQIRFGSYNEFFKILEAAADNLPIVDHELNFVFSGCYSSQARIKEGNAVSESKLVESEAFASVASLLGEFNYRGEEFKKAWTGVLFNQFHDILPGSGKMDTREHAMGLYQEAYATADTEESLALHHIASRINTDDIAVDEDYHSTVSEGAGVGGIGFGIENFQLPIAERGRGLVRIFHLFNPSPKARKEIVELTVWDWEGSIERIEITDENGRAIPHQTLTSENVAYWGHSFIKVLIEADIPALGYTTYILKERKPEDIKVHLPIDHRVHRVDSYTLENQHVKVAFDATTAEITSFVDKTTGIELVPKDRPAGIFRFIKEDDNKGMTSWIIGRYMDIENINKNVRYQWVNNDPSLLRQSLCYETSFGQSNLKVTVSLDNNSSSLSFNLECDFRELGSKGMGVPQLNFCMPFSYDCSTYKYGIPSGAIERQEVDMDVPANNWAAAIPTDSRNKALTIIAPTKYGFRGYDNSIALTLIRGSFDPDPYPEVGLHVFSFSVGLFSNNLNSEFIEADYSAKHPIRVLSARPSSGDLPKSASFVSLEEGTFVIQAIKMPESGNVNQLIIRGYETEGQNTNVAIKLFKKPIKATFVDINENKLNIDLPIQVEDNTVRFNVEPYNITTILVEF